MSDTSRYLFRGEILSPDEAVSAAVAAGVIPAEEVADDPHETIRRALDRAAVADPYRRGDAEDRIPSPYTPLTDGGVGAAVRRFREKAEITLDQLAERTGIGKQVLSRIERGTRPCRMEEMAIIASAVRRSPATVFDLAMRMSWAEYSV